MSNIDKENADQQAQERHPTASGIQPDTFYDVPSNASYFEDILSTLSDWVWEVDSNGYITYSNPAVETMLGYMPEELTGKSFLTLVPEKDYANAKLMLVKQWGMNNSADFVLQKFICRDGSPLLIETGGHGFYNNQTKEQGVRFVSRLISERWQNLTNSIRGKDSLVANTINEPIAMMDKDKNVVYINNAFTRLFGYSEEEILGKSIKILGSEKSLISSVQTEDVTGALKEAAIWQGEVQRRAKNGQYIPCMLSARATFDESDKLNGYIGTYFDMRSLRQSDVMLKKGLKATINAICNAIEDRNVLKGQHQERVTDLAEAIAVEMGKELKFIEGLTLACHLHDIGEMYIPPEIANMAGRLGDADYDMIKTHPKKGYEILKKINLPWPVADIVLQHHERMDGSGYPNGLKGEEIMLEARILAVADVVETMLTDRPYRPACSLEECTGELEKNKGKIYDEQVVDTCLRLIREKNYLLRRV